MAYFITSLLVMSEQQEVVADNTTTAGAETVDGQQEASEVTPDNSGAAKKGVEKLLSQRNEARADAAAKDERIAELEAMIEGTVNATIDLRAKKEEISNFKANVEQEVGENVESFLKSNPNLTVQQAYNALYPEQAAKKSTGFNMSGNVPQKVVADKTAQDLDEAELKEAAANELAAMGIVGRR